MSLALASRKWHFTRETPFIIAAWLAVLTPVALLFGKAGGDITISLVAVLFLIRKIRDRDFAWAQPVWIRILLLLWVYGVVRTGLVYHSFKDYWQEAVVWVRYIIYAAALADWILVHDVWRKRLFAAIVVATGFLAADACLQYVTGKDIIGHPINGNRLTATFKDPKVGITIAWLFFPGMMMFLDNKQYTKALLHGVLCFTAILLSGDRYALLATLCFFALATLSMPKIRKAALLAWLGLALVAGAAMFHYPEVYKRQVESTTKVITHLSESRYGVVWKRALAVSTDDPFFGIGFRNYRYVCPDPRFGPEKDPKTKLGSCIQHPHNIYLEWLVGAGLIGLGGFVAFALLVMMHLARCIPPEQNRYVYLGIFVTLLMRFWPLASSTSFFINWSAIPFWLMLGWGMALAREKNL